MPTDYITDNISRLFADIGNRVAVTGHVHRYTLNINPFSQVERYTYNQLQDSVNRQMREEVKKEMRGEEFIDKNPELDAFLNEYRRKEG